MDSNNRDKLRQDINSRPLTDFYALTRSAKAGRNMYNCPLCGSGTGSKGTGGLRIYENGGKYRVVCNVKGCFGEKGEDTLGALRRLWGCSEHDAMERAGYSLQHTERREVKQAAPNNDRDYTEFYAESHKRLLSSGRALDYLHGRGISDESIERFNLGFDPCWKHSKAPETVQGSPRIIIPRTDRSYTARRIDSVKDGYEKQVQGRQTDMFNVLALDGARTAFVCEGELDAISLMQAGAPVAVGIGTISNKNRIFAEMKKNPETVYLLALDNDPEKEDGRTPGQDAQKWLNAQAVENNISVLNLNPDQVYCGEKDANAALTNKAEDFKRIVEAAVSMAEGKRTEQDEARAEEMYKRSGAGMVDSFLFRAKSKEYEPLPTGIKDIDSATGGGFVKKSLVTLGAAPGMGKTALAQWILENMAKNGNYILYVNLEMSRDQLIARSLSRYVFKYQDMDVNALDIMRGYKWTEEQEEAIVNAAAKYKEEVATRLIYNPEGEEGHSAELGAIIKTLNSETLKLKAQGHEAPIVCIDYLQLVVDEEGGDEVTTIKKALKAFKDFAIENNTVVLCIVANNRASNKSGTADLESGRDTSNLEYSGDMMFGLVYTAIEDGELTPDQSRRYDLSAIRKAKRDAYKDGAEDVPDVCKRITLKINKNRFGQDERRADLIFDGKHMLYTQVGHAERLEPTKKNGIVKTDASLSPREKLKKRVLDAINTIQLDHSIRGIDQTVTLDELTNALGYSTKKKLQNALKDIGGFDIEKGGTIIVQGAEEEETVNPVEGSFFSGNSPFEDD